jgi:protein-S-isoprenylcysteine O-methyltransferase Ste14
MQMNMQPWNILFLIGFIAYVAIRGVFIEQTKRNEKMIRKVGVRERILMFIVGTGSILLPVIYLFTPLLAFADYRLPTPAKWCGVVVMAAALWLFWRSHADLGKNWSATLELRTGHQLVKTGVYRSIRHPMYAAIWLFALSQGLLLANWIGGWSALITFAIMYIVRTPHEEQMMREFFGEEYIDYMQQTGRLIPRWRRAKMTMQ